MQDRRIPNGCMNYFANAAACGKTWPHLRLAPGQELQLTASLTSGQIRWWLSNRTIAWLIFFASPSMGDRDIPFSQDKDARLSALEHTHAFDSIEHRALPATNFNAG